MDEYVGVIKAFAGNFTPKGYVQCNGQTMQIMQFQALYAILGTTYGGNGTTTFGIPDLRGRSAIGSGQGLGLATNHIIGEKTGQETVNILTTNMPAHSHTAISTLHVNDQEGDTNVPVTGSSFAAMIDSSSRKVFAYSTAAPTVALSATTITTTVGVTGGSLPISIVQPTLAINYIICVEGYFPSRN